MARTKKSPLVRSVLALPEERPVLGKADGWYCMGIDPGKTGGIAIMRHDFQDMAASRTPKDEYGMRDLMQKLIKYHDIRLCVLEKVGAMPRDAKKGLFTFGEGYGMWRMALAFCNVPYVLITPGKWMKATFDSHKGRGKVDTKELSLALARRLYPNIDLQYKVDNGKADALHMARYGVIERLAGRA